jgi:hypothetical protein
MFPAGSTLPTSSLKRFIFGAFTTLSCPAYWTLTILLCLWSIMPGSFLLPALFRLQRRLSLSQARHLTFRLWPLLLSVVTTPPCPICLVPVNSFFNTSMVTFFPVFHRFLCGSLFSLPHCFGSWPYPKFSLEIDLIVLVPGSIQTHGLGVLVCPWSYRA